MNFPKKLLPEGMILGYDLKIKLIISSAFIGSILGGIAVITLVIVVIVKRRRKKVN